MYGISEAALIKHKEFALCGKYVEPDEDVSKIEDHFESGMQLSEKFGKHHQDYVGKKLVSESALLVAILVQNDRMEEAKAAAVRLKQIATEPKLLKKLQRAIDESLNGAVPTPWP